MERLAKGLPARFQKDLSLSVRTSNLLMIIRSIKVDVILRL